MNSTTDLKDRCRANPLTYCTWPLIRFTVMSVAIVYGVSTTILYTAHTIVWKYPILSHTRVSVTRKTRGRLYVQTPRNIASVTCCARVSSSITHPTSAANGWITNCCTGDYPYTRIYYTPVLLHVAVCEYVCVCVRLKMYVYIRAGVL